MAISSQGTTFTFAGVVYTVTSVSVNYGGAGRDQRQRVSAAFLGSDPESPEPFFELWQPDPAGVGRLSGVAGQSTATTAATHTVEIEFLGVSPPPFNAVGSLAIAGPFSVAFGQATCQSSIVRLAVGDMVRGSASFSVR